jgi:major membrane immunogen (membrane-anchored lipoprotein)
VEDPKDPVEDPQEPIGTNTKLVAYGQPYKVRVVGATDSRGYFPLLEVSVNSSGVITSVYYDEAKADGTLKSANPNYYPTFVAANNMTMGDLYKIYEEHFKTTGTTEGIDATTGATNVHKNFLALATKAMMLEPSTRLTVYGNSASSYTPLMTVTIGTNGEIQNVLYDEIHDVNGSSKVANLNSSTPYFSQLLTRAFIKLDEIFKIYEFKFMHQANLESVDTVTNATRSINAFTLLSNQISKMISLTASPNIAAKLPVYGDPYTIKAVGTTLQGWTPYLIVNVAKDGTIRTVVYDEVDSLGMKKSDTLTTGNVTPTVYSGYRLAFNYYADYFKRYGSLNGIENHTTVNSISGLHASFAALVQQVLTPSSNVEITLTKDVASTAWRPELKIIVNEEGILTYAFYNEYRDGRLSKVEDPNYYPAMKDKNPDGYSIQQVFAMYDAYLVANGNIDDIDTVSGATSLHNTYSGFVAQLKEMILNRIITAPIPESTEPEVVAVEPEEAIEDPS